MSKTKAVILARYNESVDWVDSIPDDIEVIAYNKGEGVDTPTSVDRWIGRPNEGREAEAYLYHIKEQYDHLADINIFLQADPYPHTGPINFGEINIPDGFQWLSCRPCTDNKEGIPNHGGLRIGEFYEEVFNRPSPEHFTFNAGGCFAATKEQIHTRSKDWWIRVYDTCHDERFVDRYAWILERMWHHTFLDPL